jgi:nitroreductase
MPEDPEEDMDFTELMNMRRAIREFQDRDVPPALIKEIIADSCKAPSAGNRQPWSFIIIRDRSLMKRLSDESKKNILLGLDADPAGPLSGYRQILKDPGFNVFYNAPALVYITGLRDVRTVTVDCTLAAAYFMLSAADRGLGTCWVDLGSVIKDEDVRRELGLPSDRLIVATLIIGYPVQIPAPTPRLGPVIHKVIG